MKTPIATLVLFLFMSNGFTQNLNFSVHGNYKHAIAMEKLSKAGTLGDIIPFYPASWIKNYISVELVTKYDGVSATASGSNNILNKQQSNLLNDSKLGTEIEINIKYESENLLTGQTEVGKMFYSVTVIPETEAEFADGHQNLTQYIQENAIDKISTAVSEKLNTALVSFIIDEDGEISDAHISKSSGDPGVDQLLLRAVNNMPKWKPAADSKGIKVRQEFVLSVSNNEGC